ncbi:MAG: hypothetical protein K2Q25_09455, partial [Mycobacteriaceae bacterium]|nr:hypothetical protein [Mycobacteriaceae bacterium]
MAEDLDGDLTTGFTVPAAFVVGFLWLVRKMGSEADVYRGYKITPAKFFTICSIGLLAIMQEFVGVSAPFGFSAIGNPYSPENGDYFTDGAQQATRIDALLLQAAALSWHGGAASGYDMATQTLLEQVQTLADNDATMAKLVNEHARHVSQTQFNLGMLQDSLVVLFIAVAIIERLGSYEEAILFFTYSLALVLCPPFVAAGGGQLAYCRGNSLVAADQANHVDYRAVAAAARKVTADSAAALSGLASGPAGSTAVVGGATVAATPSWASAAGPRHTAPAVSTDSAPDFEGDAPPVAASVARDVPFIPVSASSGRSAQVFGGSVSSGDRAGQQGRPAVAP